MKKFFGFLTMAAMVATSCVQDQDLGANGAGEIVSVSVNVGTSTSRAFSDGSQATHLQWAVYTEGGNILNNLSGEDTQFGGQKEVHFDLATGDTYHVLFWADNEAAPYTVDLENKTMTVDYTGVVSNNEVYDAFYCYKKIKVSGPISVDAELTRPFAQLNIGSNDYEKMANAGRVITKSKVTIPAYTTLNLATGTVEGQTEQTFAYANVPTESFTVTGYDYLAMNYILVGADKEVVDVKFTYATEDGAYEQTRTVGSVPVQRNYRTNIYGSIFTSGADVNIDINPDYDGENNEQVPGVKIGNVHYNTLAEAHEAAVDGDTLVVKGDLVLTEPFVVTKTITLNLNGCSIRQEKVQTAGYEMILNDGDLTIIDSVGGGEISYTDKGNGGEYSSNTITNRGKLTVKSGEIKNMSSTTVGLNGYPYVIDSSIWGATSEVTTIVEGGKLYSEGYSAIRLRSESTTKNVTVDVTGGEIVGTIEVHKPSSSKCCGALTISGGKVKNNATANALFVFGSNGDGSGVTIAITGGEFEGKLTVKDSVGSGFNKQFVSGGVFAESSKESVTTLLAPNYELVDNGNGTWSAESPGYYVEDNVYYITSARGLLHLADTAHEGQVGGWADVKYQGKTIRLANDINCEGVAMKCFYHFSPEAPVTIDGNNKCIYNVTINSPGGSDVGLFGGTMSIKNLTVDHANITAYAYGGVIAGKLYGSLTNCHVKNSNVNVIYWQAGGLVGQFNSGSMSNCSAENVAVNSSSAVAALAGILTEGETFNFNTCSVKNCRIFKGQNNYYLGVQGGVDFEQGFGAIVGMIYLGGATINFNDCEVEGTTILDATSTSLYGTYYPGGNTIKINGVQQ